MKIDVEGFEVQVLAGASWLIEQQRPRWLVELGENAALCQRTLEIFRSAGYRT